MPNTLEEEKLTLLFQKNSRVIPRLILQNKNISEINKINRVHRWFGFRIKLIFLLTHMPQKIVRTHIKNGPNNHLASLLYVNP